MHSVLRTILIVTLILIVLLIVGKFVMDKIRQELHEAIADNKFVLLATAKRKLHEQTRPRRLNKMGRVYLPVIQRYHKGLEVEALASVAERILLLSYDALENGISEELRQLAGPTYIRQLEDLREKNRSLGNRAPKFRYLRIHDRALSHYRLYKGKGSLDIEFAVEAFVHSVELNQSKRMQYKNAIRFRQGEDHLWYPAKLKVEDWIKSC